MIKIDKTIIDILFNVNSTITSREFRAGSVVVWLSIGFYMSKMVSNLIFNMYTGYSGMDPLSLHLLFSMVSHYYTPELIPIGFIINVASFILAFKRMRAISGSKVISVLSGSINYLLFTSCLAIPMIGSMSENTYINGSMMSILTVIVLIFIIIGLINLSFLFFYKTDNIPLPIESQSSGELTIVEYLLKIGKLQIASIGAGLIVVSLIFFFPYWIIKTDVLKIATIVVIIILVGFHIRYTIARMRDAGISVFWLIGIVAAYLIFLGITFYLPRYYVGKDYLFFTSLIISLIVGSIFTACQYSLFLLSSKARCDNKTDYSDINC